MARAPSLTPSYLYHRQSGRARIVIRDQVGRRQDMLLPGAFNSPESKAEYDRVCSLLKAHRGRMPDLSPAQSQQLTIEELIVRYDDHANIRYVDQQTGEPTTELASLKEAFRPLRRLFGQTMLAEFNAKMLKAIQSAMATGSWLTDQEREARSKRGRPLTMGRSTVNKHTDRIKRLFRWGCAEDLVPGSVKEKVDAVEMLPAGRSIARETEPVEPVDVAIVEKTLPHLPPIPADMVRLLLHTGARVGELCALRGEDLDRCGPVWLYRVRRHKTSRLGHKRCVPFGPKAQLILRRYLKADPTALLFSPADQATLIAEEKRARRQTPVQPSQQHRRKAKARRQPGSFYQARSINHAIRRACKKAGVPRWTTHQLRHTAALLISREDGPEAARAVLGHKTVNMTLHYAGVDEQRAKDVMAKIG
jgi:integrase